MKIMKKSGEMELYSRDKIKNSIAASSDESNRPLTESDINRLTIDFEQLVKDKDYITSQQITIIIAGLLYTNGYLAVLEKYAGKTPAVIM